MQKGIGGRSVGAGQLLGSVWLGEAEVVVVITLFLI